MKYSAVILTAAAAATVSAQGTDGLPGCALQCGIKFISTSKCGMTDTACLCSDTAYQAKVTQCVQSGCGKSDICTAATWAAKNCKADVPAGACPSTEPPKDSGSPSNGGSPAEPPTNKPGAPGCDGSSSEGPHGTPSYGDETPAGNDTPSYGGDAPAGYDTPSYGDATPTEADTPTYGEPTGYGSSGESPTDTEAPCPESTAAGEPTPAGETPCPCATQGGDYPAPAGSSAAGYPTPAGEGESPAETPAETPCPESSAAGESTPTGYPAVTARPYPPPVATGGYPIPAPAESSAAAVPVPAYGAGNETTPAGGEVPSYESSGNKMFTLSTISAGLVAAAMLVAF